MHINTKKLTKNELKAYFIETYKQYESLFDALACDKAWYEKAIPIRHPLVFYFGHTAAFFVNKLITVGVIKNRINPEFESIFAIGVDEMSWDDVNPNHYGWPSLQKVEEYRAQVFNLVLNVIGEINFDKKIDEQHPAWIVLMGIEHERIHLETSSVLIRQLPIDYVKTAQSFNSNCKIDTDVEQNDFVNVPGGELIIDHDWQTTECYGWDNEFGRHKATLNDFAVSKYLCSNAEFLEFVNDGGYSNAEYWTEEGWKWKQYANAYKPTFWLVQDDKIMLRLMTEIVDMPWSWPVEVNYLEAKAFCNWKSRKTGKAIRLPSEDEYLHMRWWAGIETKDDTSLGLSANVGLQIFTSPCPVNMHSFNGIYDVVGNVWQWTETPIYTFEGFKVHDAYDDFSVPTFDGRHNIMKGGSWISTGNEANLHSRYAFRRHFFQHSGFRYVMSNNDELLLDDDDSEKAVSDTDVVESLVSDYTANPFNFENFEQALTNRIILSGESLGNVAEFGSKTGSLAHYLAPFSKSYTAFDETARMTQVAQALNDNKKIHYRNFDGDVDFIEIEESASNIQFLQQKAENVKPIYTGYNTIILNNVIKDFDAVKVVNDMLNRLNKGGLLIVADEFLEHNELALRIFLDDNNLDIAHSSKLVKVTRKSNSKVEVVTLKVYFIKK